MGKLNSRTELRTEKKVVRMNTKFFIHHYKKNDGTSAVWLRINSEHKEHRRSLNIYAPRNLWNPKTQRLSGRSEEALRINLILDNVEARLTDIRTEYHLRHKPLDAETLLREFFHNIPKVDFLSFFEQKLNEEKKSVKYSTWKRHRAVMRKLKIFKTNILFSEIDEKFIAGFVAWAKNKGDKPTTISGNLAVIKKFLRLAEKDNVNLAMPGSEIKVKRINGTREHLTKEEVIRLTAFYESEYITSRQKHALGLFLFTCWTGLRLGDIMRLSADNFKNGLVIFVTQKTNKHQAIPLNKSAQKLRNEIDWTRKISEQKLRDGLKEAVKQCKINKVVSFHVGRHTFATNYYKATRDVLKLKELLGHSNVRETMIYTHIVETEEDEGVFLMEQ